MIAENELGVKYLSREDIVELHKKLSALAEKGGEPIPPFSHAKQDAVDALVQAPRQKFYHAEAYPTIAGKAAIIFYMVNKQQIFLNGNKRMSTLCLLVFLEINGKALDMLPDALTTKALWLANTASLDFPAIKAELVNWIQEHLQDIP